MQHLGVYEKLQRHIVQGENIAQAYQFVATGNVPLGFVALSQVVDRKGSMWIVPDNLHEPLKQDAVLLAKGKDNPAALALMRFLKGDKAHGIIRAYGYGL
jgi:molybdate transport system substrate-binding protein